MNLLKSILLEYVRKPIKTSILGIMFILIIISAFVGISLHNIAKEGEQDAFVYHGASVFLEGESLNLTLEDYKKINNIEHVLGTFVFNSSVALPIGSKNVKEHTGAEIKKSNASDSIGDYISTLSLMDVEYYSLFQREKAVSLIKGEFPNDINNGALIESRYAKENNLDIGDNITFQLQESDKICEFKICGIYQVDSDFEILDADNVSENIYTASPYNIILLNYETAIEQMGFTPNYQNGCGIYVDRAENNERVAASVKEIFGDTADVYSETTKDFNETFGVISIMQNYSYIVLIGICGIGGILLLIVLSFFANQNSYECGIYLALGEKKYRIALRYIISMFALIIVSFMFAIIIYHFTASFFVSTINENATRIMNHNGGGLSAVGPYDTPDLGQGFKLALNIATVYSFESIVIIIGYMLGCLVLSLLIPIYQIYIIKPRNILNSK